MWRFHRQHKLLQLYITSQCGVSKHSSSSSSSRTKPPISQKVKFVDQLRVVAKGGNGGGGASALFGRTGHHPRAAGGNGAPGGTVVLRASKQLTGLGSIPLHIEAAKGGNGGKQWMDGKRGADRIVDVPLGTLVYQLLQLRGAADRPHGVTAVQPDTVTASSLGMRQRQHHQEQQQQQVISSAGANNAVDVAAWQQGVVATQGNAIGSSCSSSMGAASSSSSSSMSRRKLFPQLGQVQSAARDPAQQSHCTGSNSSSGNSSSTIDSPSTKPRHTHSGSVSDTGAAAATAAEKHSATVSDGCETEALFEQLVSGQRQLTNAEKLSLLNTGRLPMPNCGPHGLWGADGCAAAAAEETLHSDDSSEDEADGMSGTDDEPPASEDDDWIVLPPAEGDNTAAAAGGVYGDELERQFSKKQVWSILESQAVLLGELTQEGQTLTVATGGQGGRGNAVSASKPYGPASRARTDGQPGQEVMLLLKLKLLADVVLVGLPNVGKSSLIAALTHARAQVGSYAFTTLRPQLGTVIDTDPLGTGMYSASSDQPITPLSAVVQSNAVAAAEAAAAEASGPAVTASHSQASSSSPGSSRLVLADLPGLVPGAHAGKGRGTAFLAHLQRARCLALVIDMTGAAHQERQEVSAADSRVQTDADGLEVNGWEALVPYTPSQQLAILQDELQRFDASVLQLPIVVVANKVDMMSPEAAALALESLKATTILPIVPVSAKQGLGLHRLKSALLLLVGRSSRHSSTEHQM